MTINREWVAESSETGADRALRMPCSLRRNFAWTVLGNAVLAGCQWATFVVIAKLGTVEMVGTFAFAFAVALPIAFIVHMQLRTLFVTDLENHYPFAQMLGLRYGLAGAAALILLAVLLFTHQKPASLAIIGLVCLAQVTDSISENYFAIAQRAERMDRISRSQLLRGLLSLAGVAVMLLMTHSVVWGASAFALGKLLVLFAYDAAPATLAMLHEPGGARPRGRLASFRPEWNAANQMRLFWVVLPIGVASILILLTGNMPRYVIAKYLGAAAVGIYAALGYLPASMMMVATALGNAAFARLSRDYYLGNVSSFVSVLVRSVAACAAMGLGSVLLALLCGRRLLLLLYRPEYANHTQLLLLLMIVGCTGCVTACLGCAMSAAQQFRIQVPVFVFVALSAFLACRELIPRYGLMGAAAAAGLAMTVQMVGSIAVLWHAIARCENASARSVRMRHAAAQPLSEG